MKHLKIADLKLTAEDMTQVKGGGTTYPKVEMEIATTTTTQRIGLLLPAVQKIR
jgi:hypothetical protein